MTTRIGSHFFRVYGKIENVNMNQLKGAEYANKVETLSMVKKDIVLYKKGGSTMISLPTEDFKQIFVKDLLISSEKVAHVQAANSLEHAMLVLVKSGYSSIPVLDTSYKLQGLISTAMILDRTLGMERIEFERLEKMKVADVMNVNIPRLGLNDTFAQGLDMVINHPFVCVENEDGCFEGILTRRAILKLLGKKVRRYNK